MTAQSSLLIKQFTSPTELDEAAVDRKKAGVDVRVMLNPQRSGGDRANDESYEQFKDAGIDVQWSNPKFYVTHEKSIVVDGAAAMVATFNLMIKYFTLTRDYGIITHDRQHVEQIVDVFNADWEHRDFTPATYDGLLWSNSNSRYHMARFIDTAETHLYVQHPKYVDAVILDHIAAAADRGVKVRSFAAVNTASASGTSSTRSPHCAHCADSGSRCASRRTCGCTPSSSSWTSSALWSAR